MSPSERAYWIGKDPFERRALEDATPPPSCASQCSSNDAWPPKSGARLVSGEAIGDRRSEQVAQRKDKAEAKREKEVREAASVAKKKGEWEAIVAAQGNTG